MRHIENWTAVLVLAGYLLAPASTHAARVERPGWEDTAQELGSLGGYVREGDPDQGMEIEGAVVTLSDGQVAFTNGRGYFEFQGIPAGAYVISVEAECYEPNAVDAFVEPDTLNIQNVGLEPIPGCEADEGGCSAPARLATGSNDTGRPAGAAAGWLVLSGLLLLGLRARRHQDH